MKLGINEETIATCIVVVCGIEVEDSSISCRQQSVFWSVKERKTFSIAYIMLVKHRRMAADKKPAPGPTGGGFPSTDHS